MMVGVRFDNGKTHILKVVDADVRWEEVARITKEEFPYVATALVSVPLKPALPCVESQSEAA